MSINFDHKDFRKFLFPGTGEDQGDDLGELRGELRGELQGELVEFEDIEVFLFLLCRNSLAWMVPAFRLFCVITD